MKDCEGGIKIVVLHGLGGVGKTQLSRKYIAENHQHYTMVYTLDGQSEETINQGYKDLVFRLSGIDMNERSPADVRDRVNTLLAQQDNKGWLLLFDNVDDSAVLDSLYDKLPKHGGNIVITSRVVLDWEDIAVIEVNQFERTDSISLLEKIIRKDRQCDHETLNALAEALGDLPLALSQAGAYIKSFKQKGYNAAKYLTAFQKSYADAATRLDEFKSTVEYHNRKIITATWDTSRERIIVRCPLADEALCLFAFLNPEKIPSDWITGWLQNRGIQDKEELEEKTSEIINTLYEGYSMIHYEEEEGISIHRLVQRVVQGSLTEGERGKFIEETLRLVKDKFDPYDYYKTETWKVGIECLPHAISVTNHILKDIVSMKKSAISDSIKSSDEAKLTNSESRKFSRTDYKTGKDIAYEKPEEEILKTTAFLLHLMGAYVYRQGEASQAMDHYEKALAIFEKTIGPNSLEYAFTLNNLGATSRDLGDHNKGEQHFKEALQIFEMFRTDTRTSRHSLCNNAQYGETQNNLGIVYSDLNKCNEAKECFKGALETFTNYCANSPTEGTQSSRFSDVASSLCNLGNIYIALGREKESVSPSTAKKDYNKAIKNYEAAFNTYHDHYGPKHPDTIQPLRGLAIAHCCLKNYEKAQTKIESALTMYLTMCKTLYGEVRENSTLASILLGKGNVHSAKKEYSKAQEYFEKAYEIYKKHYDDENHHSVADALNNLGLVYQACEDYNTAEAKVTQAIKMYMKNSLKGYDENHPDVKAAHANLKAIQERKSFARYKEHIPLPKKCILHVFNFPSPRCNPS